MTGDLAWGIDDQRFIALFEIDGVKQPCFVEPDNMLEIPTHQNINLGDSGQGDVQHVVQEPLAKNAMRNVVLHERYRIFIDPNDLRR